MVFVVVDHRLGHAVDDYFRLINENYLHCFVAHPEYHSMLRPKPPFDVDKVPRVQWNDCLFPLWFFFILEVTFEMVKQTDLLLQLGRIVTKAVLL